MPEKEKREETEDYQYSHTAKEVSLKTNERKKGYVIGGLAGVALTAGFLLLKECDDCNGDYNPVSQTGAGGATYVGDAGAPKDKDPCYNEHLNSLQNKLDLCNRDKGRNEGLLEACLEEKNQCIAERDELRKRPKSCPTYTPRACPPVKECPKSTSDYFRQGR